MIRCLSSALALTLGLCATTLAFDGGPGNPYCFGVGCPCGNDDPDAGCINSSGDGGLLTVTGSSSVSADDAQFHGTQLSRQSVVLLVMADAQQQVPFQNGLLCLAGDIQRMQQHQNTGQTGSATFSHVVERYSWQGIPIVPGDTRHFQLWFRDVPSGQSPCGFSSNLTNATTIVFTP